MENESRCDFHFKFGFRFTFNEAQWLEICVLYNHNSPRQRWEFSLKTAITHVILLQKVKIPSPGENLVEPDMAIAGSVYRSRSQVLMFLA